jgi:hypothetical protein
LPDEATGGRYNQSAGFYCLPGFKFLSDVNEVSYNVTCRTNSITGDRYVPSPDFAANTCVRSIDSRRH